MTHRFRLALALAEGPDVEPIARELGGIGAVAGTDSGSWPFFPATPIPLALAANSAGYAGTVRGRRARRTGMSTQQSKTIPYKLRHD